MLNIQFSYHFNEHSTLQLINGISKDLQKLPEHFNGTAIFTPSFFLFAPSTTVSPIRFDLYLKDEELLFVILIFPIILSLLKFHKLPEMYQNNYHYIQLDYT